MATPYRFKRSSISGKRPTLSDLEKGELALNFYDGHLFTEVDTGGVGIGTTISNLTPWKERFGGGQIDYTGIVTATTYHGDQIVGTPTVGSFRAGAMQSPAVDDKTKDQVEELNYILGKLVPNQPDTIDGVNLILDEGSLAESTKRPLCAGFTPVNNTPAATAPSAGTAYYRNVDNVISTGYLTEYGPGDSGTINAYINSVGVGTTALNVSFGLYATKSDNGTYDKLQIANEKDAADSTRNTGIASNFYEVLDMRILSAVSPVGFNSCWIKHGAAVTASNVNSYWYEEDNPPGVPDMTFSAVTAPSTSSHQIHYSSGVPHYKNHSSNSFSYVISVTNATGDMYYSTNNRLLWAESATTGFTRPDQYKLFNETYVSGVQGTHPPQRDWGVGTAATVTATHTPNNIHATISSNHFHRWDCWTPYGNDQNERATLAQSVNIMGTTADYTNNVDEDAIECTVGSLTGGSATRVNAGATGDNPTPVYTAFDATSTPAVYEAIVRGGDLRHDVTDYSNTSNWLPTGGPDLSSGRSGNQYFQMQFIQSAISQFNISYTGALAGCWVCMPDNSTWTTSLSGKNGWADMFQAYRGAGVPTTAEPGCSSGGLMDTNGGTFTCVFGTESSSNDSNNRVLIRFKLTSGQSISDISFSDT